MFTIDCRLVNVTPNRNADAKNVVEELRKALTNVELKIIGAASSVRISSYRAK